MTEARVIGHMVTKNVRGLPFDRVLRHLFPLVDLLVVYDDQSDDDTLGQLRGLHNPKLRVRRRTGKVPSFLENESAFREAAWRAMEKAAQPTENDWILCLDADEILASTHSTGAPDVFLDWCRSGNCPKDAVTFHVDEVYDNSGAFNTSEVRVDGFWGQINACRLVRWRPGGHFDRRRQGCGSVPAGWQHDALVVADPVIVHYGYCTETLRLWKYERYTTHAGHNPAHIESIVTSPILRRVRHCFPRPLPPT